MNGMTKHLKALEFDKVLELERAKRVSIRKLVDVAACHRLPPPVLSVLA